MKWFFWALFRAKEVSSLSRPAVALIISPQFKANFPYMFTGVLRATIRLTIITIRSKRQVTKLVFSLEVAEFRSAFNSHSDILQPCGSLRPLQNFSMSERPSGDPHKVKRPLKPRHQLSARAVLSM